MLHPLKSVVETWDEKPFNKSTKKLRKVENISDRSDPIKIYAFILFKMSFLESAEKSAPLSVRFKYQIVFP